MQPDHPMYQIALVEAQAAVEAYGEVVRRCAADVTLSHRCRQPAMLPLVRANEMDLSQDLTVAGARMEVRTWSEEV